MKYTKEQRLDIGREIYEGKLTRYEAAEKYNINDQTARDYMRLYRDVNNLPPKRQCHQFNEKTFTFSRVTHKKTINPMMNFCFKKMQAFS